MDGTGRTTRLRWFLFYLISGLLPGLADGALGRWVHHFGGKPGFATALCVNVLLPGLAVALAVCHRRISSAWLGAVVLTVAYTVGLAAAHPRGLRWEIVPLLRSVRPVLVVACVGYGVLGSVGILASRGVAGGRGVKA